MKLALFNLCFAFCVFCLMLSVEGRSPMQCPDSCDTGTCQEVSCNCGSYKDECHCCDICYKCEGEVCSIVEADACVKGTTCTHPPGSSAADIYNNPGICKKN
ncbi:hypothetical protein X975_26526, partial [Stegodyphus mimosarum]